MVSNPATAVSDKKDPDNRAYLLAELIVDGANAVGVETASPERGACVAFEREGRRPNPPLEPDERTALIENIARALETDNYAISLSRKYHLPIFPGPGIKESGWHEAALLDFNDPNLLKKFIDDHFLGCARRIAESYFSEQRVQWNSQWTDLANRPKGREPLVKECEERITALRARIKDTFGIEASKAGITPLLKACRAAQYAASH